MSFLDYRPPVYCALKTWVSLAQQKCEYDQLLLHILNQDLVWLSCDNGAGYDVGNRFYSLRYHSTLVAGLHENPGQSSNFGSFLNGVQITWRLTRNSQSV